MPTVTSPIRFGVFEVDLRSGELRKSGVRIHIADQPLQVLAVLLDRPGEVVTREELRQRLWPEHTFVDFENGLNAAVRRLRDALGDSAENPRYIETIPRHGYRFIVPPAEISPPVPSVVTPQPAITPPDSSSGQRPATGAKPWRRYGLAIGIAATLIVIAAGAWRIMASLHQHRAGADDAARTIAVLPFADMSPAKDQEYFADGLAEELITNLVRIPELRVSARTSSFQFRGEGNDPRSVGEKLHVKSIVEGGVRKYGNRVRITVQLVNAADGFQLWADTFDRDLTDIFVMQAEIAKAVAESLKVSLLETKSSPIAADARDIEAYNLYLQGRYFAERRGRDDIPKAIHYYEQALKLNPNSARTWAGLAEARMYESDSAYVSVEEGYGKARVAVERALALDPNLGKAHECMGWIKLAHDWNWQGANASFERALTLEPGSAITLWKAARLYAIAGSLEKALTLNRKAVDLDPLNTQAYLNLGDTAYYRGRQDEAASALEKAVELNPELPVARAYLGRVYLLQGRLQDARNAFDQETELPWRLYGLALVNHRLNRQTESDAALATLIEKYRDGFAFQIAQIYANRADADHAFTWLQKAYTQRDGGLTELKGDPLLKNIAHDARYAALLKGMNLEGEPTAILGSTGP